MVYNNSRRELQGLTLRCHKRMTTPNPIDYEDLEVALDWSSSGGPYEYTALICRTTGRVYLKSMDGGFVDEEVPEDIEDGALYIAAPHKSDLDLGQDLVFQFVETEAPELQAQVHAIFRRRGAYSRFKSLLDRYGLLQKWYEYEKTETRSALIRWAQENGLVVIETKRDGVS